jgi:Protein of unknown function (DUF998)
LKNKLLMLCGMLAPVIYVAAVIMGGILRPGYSHASQFVSELIATGAPNTFLLNPLFAIYNFLTMVFGLGLVIVVRSRVEHNGKAVGAVGAIILIIEGVAGFATLFFPQDSMGDPVSTTGAVHIVLAGLSSLTCMLSMLLIGFWFKCIPEKQGYGLYSFISVAAVFISGGLAAVTGASRSPILGVMERLAIGGFLQWLFVIALALYSSTAAVSAPNRLNRMHPREPHPIANR